MAREGPAILGDADGIEQSVGREREQDGCVPGASVTAEKPSVGQVLGGDPQEVRDGCANFPTNACRGRLTQDENRS